MRFYAQPSLLAAAITLGLNAGFFYTWSFTVMQALDFIAPDKAISAMQSVNANIRNAWFGVVFFGAPLLTLVALILNARVARRAVKWWSVLALVAIATTFIVTMQWHVPWNDALGTLTGIDAPADPQAVWQAYSAQWTRANHVRTGASLTAFIAMLFALRSSLT